MLILPALYNNAQLYICSYIRSYLAVSLLEEIFSRITFCCLLLYSTFRVITKNRKFTCIVIKIILQINYIHFTSIITTMGTMNAKIAPSSDLIQQLLSHKRV